MSTLVEQQDNWIITLPKNAFPKEFLIRLLEIIRTEELISRNQMTPEQAWALSEDIKSAWWEANGQRILSEIKRFEDESGR